jgi:hypothetical protein
VCSLCCMTMSNTRTFSQLRKGTSYWLIVSIHPLTLLVITVDLTILDSSCKWKHSSFLKNREFSFSLGSYIGRGKDHSKLIEIEVSCPYSDLVPDQHTAVSQMHYSVWRYWFSLSFGVQAWSRAAGVSDTASF